MSYSVHSVFIVPTGTLRLPWLRIFRAFPQFQGKCQGIIRKDGARPALFPLGDNFYTVISSLILVWPLWVRIPASLPTKVVNCVVLCIVYVPICNVLLPPGVNPIAANKYISRHISYHTISYHISYHIICLSPCSIIKYETLYTELSLSNCD